MSSARSGTVNPAANNFAINTLQETISKGGGQACWHLVIGHKNERT